MDKIEIHYVFYIVYALSIVCISVAFAKQRRFLNKFKEEMNNQNFIILSQPKVFFWLGCILTFLINVIIYIQESKVVPTVGSPTSLLFSLLFLCLLCFWASFEVAILTNNRIERSGIFRKPKLFYLDQVSDYQYSVWSGNNLIFKNGSVLSISDHFIGNQNLMEIFAQRFLPLLQEKLHSTRSQTELLRIIYLLGLSGDRSSQQLILAKYLNGNFIVKQNAISALMVNVAKSKFCEASVLEVIPSDIRRKIDAYLKEA